MSAADPSAILRFCTAQSPWLIETLSALVRLESPSTDRTAVDRCGAELARRLVSIGGRVRELGRETRGNLVRAEFRSSRPDADSRPPVLMLGHVDTVWPLGTIDG